MQKSVGRMGRRGLGKDSTVRRGMQIGHLPIVLQIGRPRTNVIGGVRKSAPSTAFVGRARPCSRSSAAPQRRRGEEADGSVFRPRPEAATPCGKTGTVGRMCKPLTRTGQKNVRTNPDTPTGTPSRRIRHTHPIHGRLRTPGKPAQAATSPAQRASGTETTCRTQRNSSPTTSLSPTSSHAESALTAPRRTPSARSAATNRTTRSVPSAPQPRRLQCPQPCRIQRSQPPRPDTTFAAPPDTAFPHRSRTIPSTPLRPVRYKSGTAAARTAESRSKLW